MSILDKLLHPEKQDLQMTPEQKVTQAQIDQLEALEKAREKAAKQENLKVWQHRFQSVFKGVMPKGIRDPNSMVTNKHLYIGGSGKTTKFL